MNLNGLTYVGPAVNDPDVLSKLPDSLRTLLEQINGFILFGGALHVRGACREPKWHSLKAAWAGETAFHQLYSSVDVDWIPFAEDCVGDQFFLVNGFVLSLLAETGEVHPTNMTLHQFLEAVEADPVKALSAGPLLRLMQEKGQLPEGKLIFAYPPFCTEEARDGVDLSAVDAWEVHEFHAKLARSMPATGGKFEVKIVD